jgi:hypothetical protein
METPTTYFPDQSVEFGFTFGLSFNTIEMRLSNRRRQARLLDPRPQRTLEGRVPTITWDTSESIRNFITARGGNFKPFYIFAWMPQKVTGYVIDPAFDAANEPYTLPFLVNTIDVFDDGTPSDIGGESVGSGGELVITAFDPIPASGSVMTADIIGRERVPVVLNGNVLHVEHPLHRPQDASGPADFYSIPVIEVF